jgi:hypothetical protein
VGKPEGRRSIERPRGNWEDNIEISFKEIGWEGMDWIDLGEDKDKRRAVVNTVMKFAIP